MGKPKSVRIAITLLAVSLAVGGRFLVSRIQVADAEPAPQNVLVAFKQGLLDTPIQDIDSELEYLLASSDIDVDWFYQVVADYVTRCGGDFTALPPSEQLEWANVLWWRMQAVISEDGLKYLAPSQSSDRSLKEQMRRSELTVEALHGQIFARVRQLVPEVEQDSMDQVGPVWDKVFVAVIGDVLSDRRPATAYLTVADEPLCLPTEPSREKSPSKTRPVRVAIK
ncbi:MAG: hypothetical protein ACFBSG_05410 [Leptolyngbyaceae cyanobacterium]